MIVYIGSPEVTKRVYHKMKKDTMCQAVAVCYVCGNTAHCYSSDKIYYCATHMLQKQKGELRSDKNNKKRSTSTTI